MSSQSQRIGGSRQSRRITRARVRDLEYYLGNDWIDYGVISADIVIEIYRDIATSAYQPMQCPSCKKYWNWTLSSENKKRPTYLRQDVFGGIPTEKEVCWEC